MKLTRENIKNFDMHLCEITDFEGDVVTGYLVIKDKEYIILPVPLHTFYGSFHFKFSHIKKIKFLNNGFELKK